MFECNFFIKFKNSDSILLIVSQIKFSSFKFLSHRGKGLLQKLDKNNNIEMFLGLCVVSFKSGTGVSGRALLSHFNANLLVIVRQYFIIVVFFSLFHLFVSNSVNRQNIYAIGLEMMIHDLVTSD